MKKYIVFNDLHIGGGHDLKIDVPTTGSDNVILNGDIVDLTGCSKKDVSRYLELQKDLHKAHGKRYIIGNHECSASGADAYIDNQWQGAFTWAYSQLIDPALTWADIYQRVVSLLGSNGFSQVPQLNGAQLDTRPIFGGI